jgi:transmembrane sensor
MTRDQIDLLANKYASGTASMEERLLFEAALEKMHLNNIEDVPEDLTSPLLEKRMLEKLHDTIIPKKPSKSTWKKVSLEWGAIAASVLVLFGVWISMQYLSDSNLSKDVSSPVVYSVITQPGEKTRVVLGDGSEVMMNSDSEITYTDFKNDSVREIHLKGEAFFDVVKDTKRPFIVKSGKLITRVLGTSFNISSYDDLSTMHVTVATGKVQVEDVGAKRIFDLNPAQQLSYNKENSEINQSEVDVTTITAWKENVLVFESMPMHEVARVLERWYGISVKFEDDALAMKTISGRYQNDHIYNLLEGLTFMLEADYRIEGERSVVIYK